MISQRTWAPESVLQLLGFLLLGFGALVLLNAGLHSSAERLGIADHEKSVALVVGTLGFHGGALIAVFVFLRLNRLSLREGLGLRTDDASRALRFGVGAALVMLPVAWALGKLSVQTLEMLGIPAPRQDSIELLQKLTSPALRIYFGIFAVFIAPIAEEVLFRGIFYPAVKQIGYPRLALWGTSLLFGAIHANKMSFVPLVVLALALVWIYEQTDNLLAPIFAHSLFNTANLIALLLFPEAADPSPS